MKIFFTLLILCSANSIFAQDTIAPKEPFYNEIIEFPDVKPSYPDGYESMVRWVNSHFYYPIEMYLNKEEGSFIISFVVEKNGSIKEVKVTGDAENQYYVTYVMSSMPRWNPGKVNDKPVRTRSKLRIVYALI